MKIPLGTILVLVILLSRTADSAEGSFEITSAKSAFVDHKVLYVSAGYPKNHEGFQGQLNVLWEKAGPDIRIDVHRQPWRRASMTDLVSIYGSIDNLYIAVFGDEVFIHKATNAFLMRWACDGSVIPILDIGQHKFHKEPTEWGVDAFGVSSLPDNLKIKPVDKALIPQDFYGPLRYPAGWELWVNGKKRFTYIDINEDHNVAPRNLLLDHESGSKRTIVEKSPMDERC